MPQKLLIVDDEEVIADTLAVILRSCGYQVAVCYNAESALRECGNAAPDLVISDVAMPGMNGVEMAVIIRERHPACKILLFSGQASSLALLEEARRRGHNFELLPKPIHPKDLLARIEEEAETPAGDTIPLGRKPPQAVGWEELPQAEQHGEIGARKLRR